jgi:hypothetical protein
MKMADLSDKFFGSIPKNDTNEVRIQRRTYQGHTYLDVREYYQVKDSDEWRPTKKGITFGWKQDVILSLVSLMDREVRQEAYKCFSPIEAAAAADEGEKEQDEALIERGAQRNDSEAFDDDIPF